MMIERIIPEEVRSEAHRIARITVIEDNIRGRHHLFIPRTGMDTLEAHWIGAIGEIMLQRAWPLLRRVGEPVFRASGYLPELYHRDFDHPIVGTIEVKTRTLPLIFRTIYVNAESWKRRQGAARFLVLTRLDDRPQWARIWSPLGWLPYQMIGAYPLKTENVDSPCYDVELEHLRPMEDLLGNPAS